uniref:Uncharacterized protein n=1 Tax=Cyanoptyche gloeocystis TaxID=77922 RepID=A0A7S2JLC3_9EUKA|mmetsp:Transcript_1997/g.3741  ORF Transcript_1997/g.3741 Transcript_1997/m.3741 type:complete len:390 (+) Transcript_1997:64-1233(+)|eukprot:CAMPEP_0196654448 /NCGR_PEP_ID=MMETSP1086-20130531/4158_1 /TAXON_ID=77921 /ORGANISM="Cyanoptyche  gloeocystis , Strain SAG4.97" /LENGTH=389 /DNA_ID=CAMNT_0041986213 /DNA_START=53 /DNA_END=1222 /DNA_ORIENTATION=+
MARVASCLERFQSEAQREASIQKRRVFCAGFLSDVEEDAKVVHLLFEVGAEEGPNVEDIDAWVDLSPSSSRSKNSRPHRCIHPFYFDVQNFTLCDTLDSFPPNCDFLFIIHTRPFSPKLLHLIDTHECSTSVFVLIHPDSPRPETLCNCIVHRLPLGQGKELQELKNSVLIEANSMILRSYTAIMKRSAEQVCEDAARELFPHCIPFAAAACAGSLAPVPGVGTCINAALVQRMAKKIIVAFGLTPEQVDRVLREVPMGTTSSAAAATCKSVIQELSMRFLMSKLSFRVIPATIAAERSAAGPIIEVSKYVPALGTTVSMGSTFFYLLWIASGILKECERVALLISEQIIDGWSRQFSVQDDEPEIPPPETAAKWYDSRATIIPKHVPS